MTCDSANCPNPASVQVTSLDTLTRVYSCADCLTAGWRAFEALKDSMMLERPGASVEVLTKPRAFWSTVAGYELATRLRKEVEET